MRTRVVIIAIIALIAADLGTTWFLAQAERTQEALMWGKVEEQSHGMLKVVSTKIDSHFFTASEDIKLQINNPIVGALFSQDKEHSSCAAEISLHNDIAFGPLPKFRSVGVARIETTVLLSDELRKKLVESIGTDKPLQFISTLGFTGNSRLDIVSAAVTIRPKDENESGEWKGGSISFNTSKSMDASNFEGHFPGLIINAKNKTSVNVDDMSLTGSVQRKFDVLFTGEETFSIGNVSTSSSQNAAENISAKNLSYGFKSSADDQFMNIGLNMNSGALVSKEYNVKEVHFSLGGKHLDAKALAALYKVYNDVQTKAMASVCHSGQSANATPPDGSTADADKPDFEAIKQRTTTALLTLLQHSPVLALDNISFATTDGALKFIGSATIDGVEESDLTPEVQYKTLLGKLSAQADFAIDQALIDHWPVKEDPEKFKQQISALESQGFLLRKGTKLESHIEYKGGKVTANGKPIGG